MCQSIWKHISYGEFDIVNGLLFYFGKKQIDISFYSCPLIANKITSQRGQIFSLNFLNQLIDLQHFNYLIM